jgi:uncharacterized protein (DUF58 family)
MVPTKRFWGLIALGIPIAAIAAQMGSPLIAVAYNAVLILAAWITGRMAPSTKALRLVRKFDPVLSVRAANRIQVYLENDGAEPIEGLMRDEPPPRFFATRREFPLSLEPGQVSEVSYFLTPDERGTDYFRGTYLRLKCPLGLVQRQVKLNTEQPIRVYPNVLALREFDLLKQQGRLREMGIRRSRTRGLGTEFESLREYAEGDDFRKIDWKASARRSPKLVVRQYEQERNQSVIICIDVGRHMLAQVDGVRKLDHALDSCLMLTHAAAMAGDLVGLLIYSDVVKRYIPPKKGRNQVGTIIEALHDVLAEPVETDTNRAFAYLSTRWKRRALIVVFTDSEDADRAREIATALGPMAKRHLTLVARVADPRLKEALNVTIQKPADMYIKAAANLLQSDRRAAGSVLSTVNIHSLEAEPQELASALVNYYFVVKEKSVL